VRNFRLWFAGQFISVIGNWMQMVAVPVLVLDKMDRGGTVLGIVVAMLYVPVMVFGPWGGVVSDRFPKRRIVITTQLAFTASVGALGLLVVTDHLSLWAVMLLASTQGVINAFDNPARQTFVHEMVGADLLTNAVGLNMLEMNTARVIGPAIAALLLEVTSVGTLFLLNALSFLGAVVGLSLMRTSELRPTPRVPAEPGQIRNGLRYVRDHPTLRVAITMLVPVGMFAYNFPVVFPLLVKTTFDLPKERYGTFFSVMGIGAIVFALARGTRTVATTRRLTIGTLGLGSSLVALGLAPTPLMAYLVLPFVGAGSVNFLTLMNATLQLSSSSEMRGRVMALYTMALLGTTPLGSFIMGWTGEHIGPREAAVLGGGVTMAAALWAWSRFPAPHPSGRRADQR
jgi:MFS family permease